MSAGTQTLTLDDFLTGLLAGLAHDGTAVISIREQEFYSAIKAAYELLCSQAEDAHLELLFHVAVSRVYRDSPDVREAITRAVQRDLVSLDNPEYQDLRLKLTAVEADSYLAKLPGGRDLFLAIARRFTAEYPYQR